MGVFEHTMISGQSLSVGHSGIPGISTTPENGALEGLGDGTLVPLQIGQDPTADQPTRQRPQFSLGYRLAEARGGVTTVTSTDGQGSSTIEELSKGGATGEYEALVARAQAIRSARVANGDTYVARALHWVQGEADQSASTPIATYVGSFDAYHAEVLSDLGLPELPVLASQTSTQGFTWNVTSQVPLAPIAQLDLHRSRDWFTLVGPHYAVPRADDQLHLNGVGYYHLGEYHARASLAQINGTGWDPLMPISVGSNGRKVTIRFSVPVAPLVFDTTLVDPQPNHGFSVHDTDAQIASVQIGADGESVEIGLDRYVATSLRVGYAVGPTMYRGRGNLRDSETAVSGHDAAPLPNWSVLFLETVPPPHAKAVFRARPGALRLVRQGGARLVVSHPAGR